METKPTRETPTAAPSATVFAPHNSATAASGNTASSGYAAGSSDSDSGAPEHRLFTESARSHLRWGAIFGGGVAALGIASLLYALGLALGLSWIDPRDAESLRPSGIFSAVWMFVVSLVALFVGGYVAARGAGAARRGYGALHGLVMWGLCVVAGVWLLGNVASAMVRGGAAVGGAAMNTVGRAMPSVAELRDMPGRPGVATDDLLASVNDRLRSTGKPEVTAQQLENATRDVLQRSVRDGTLDRETLMQAITTHTDLSRVDAERIAADTEARFQTARAEVERRLESAGQTALAVAEESSKAFWALFGALLLGMVAAIAGAVVATDRGDGSSRRLTSTPRPVTPRAQPASVYP